MKQHLSNKVGGVKSALNKDDGSLDQTLRPNTFEEYIGQSNVKQNLHILLNAARKRGEILEHILLHGPPGLGKTTLAYIIARENNAQIKTTSGATLEKVGDIGSILTNLEPGNILFIDEVHRLNKHVEEILYPAMESFKLDIIIGKGTAARTLQIDLPRFTLIAATTRISLLSSPFRARFGAQYKLRFYEIEELEKILDRSARLLGVKLSPPARKTLAQASRATPRIANRLLKRTRDYAQFNTISSITPQAVNQALELLKIDAAGLEETDREILRLITTKFHGGPVGLKTLAAILAEEEDTIAEVYEPYLIQAGFLVRTARGRIVTLKGQNHLQHAQARLL